MGTGTGLRSRCLREVDAEVHIRTDGDHMQPRVRDDGVGPPTSPTRDSGLGNMGERAESLGGTCSFGAAPDGCALPDWRVPLD
ncbi:hypothetical protein [Streptomyces scabrisporus]|uniref:hypothetical protein n=1 Tax=Embleya scabrispora TaxID=159449 RepID=UPI00038166A5